MFAMAVLLLAVSFAIVGRGNRLLWAVVFPVPLALLFGIPYVAITYFEQVERVGGVLLSLLIFALMPVLFALFLAAAYTLRLRRSPAT